MNQLILEDGSPQRLHREFLGKLVDSTEGTIRIATAYVTDRELIRCVNNREIRLLISLSPMDIVSGATSIETLGWMLKKDVKCRVLPNRPRLHAKVYIFGTSNAVVTSANLTGGAFDSNIEVGVEVGKERVSQLIGWYDHLWGIATPLTVDALSELQGNIASLRHEYVRLKNKSQSKLTAKGKFHPPEKLTDALLALFSSAPRFFVCNTDRRQGQRTPTGGFVLEEEMHSQGFAAAWETFKFPSHMEQVEPGDAVFVFAKGVGIIGIGIAVAQYETLSPDDPDCIRHYKSGKGTKEWRIPVRWLAWTDEAGAYTYDKAPNFTFWNVTGSKYDDFRQGVRAHFLGDV